MAKKTLPKTLFVKIDHDAAEPYFVADEQADYLVEMGETVKIGKYQLVEITNATGVAQMKRAR